MSPEPFEGVLLSKLLELIPNWQERYVVSTVAFSSDVATDPDLTMKEVYSLDPGVRVDARYNQKRVELQIIRGQLRYSLISTRDPYEMSIAFDQERGVLPSVEAAAELCHEYLDNDIDLSELTTSRDVIHRARER